MVTMIEGVKVMVWDGIESLGFDGVHVHLRRTPRRTSLERKKLGHSRGLTVRDVDVLDRRRRALDAVAALRMRTRSCAPAARSGGRASTG